METTRSPQDLCATAFSKTESWEERLKAATELIPELTSLQSELVTVARLEGATWERVGDALGVSYQAAQRRFGPKPKPKPMSASASAEKALPTSTPEKQDLSPRAPKVNEVTTPAPASGGLVVPVRTEPDCPPSVWGYTARIGGLPVVRVERLLERPASGARRGRWGRRTRHA